MIKTFVSVGSHRLANHRLPVMMQLASTVDGFMFEILNLDHCDFFEIWFLVLGIYVIIVKQISFTKSVNYFC
jgi:hypothetical protein